MNKEKAQLFLNENKEGIDKAEKEMAKDRHYNLSYTGLVGNSEKGEALKEVVEEYKEQGMTLLDEYGDGTYLQFSIHLNADAQSAYETINAFENDLRNKAKELGDEHMFDDVLNVSSDSLNQSKETIEKFGDTYKQALVAEIVSDDDKSKTYGEALKAVEVYNEAILKSEYPYDDRNVTQAKENLDAIKASIQGNEEEWGKYSVLFDDVFKQADTRLLEFNESLETNSGLNELASNLEGLSDIDLKALDENVGQNDSFDKLKVAASEYKVSVDELIGTLVRLGYVQGEIQSENTDKTPIEFNPESFSETVEALSSLQSVYNDFYNNVKANNDFTFEFSDIENLREAFGDTCAEFENFEKLATSSSTSAEKLQQSFDTLATQYVIASLDGLNESTREQIVSQLELQGIIGSSELLTEELASAYGILSDNGYTLSDATNTAYWSLLNEADASEITKGSIYALAAAEIAYNNTGLDVQGKISQLGQLAKAYGDTATAAIAQAAADRVANGHGDYESIYADMMASANRVAQTSTLKLGQSSSNVTKGKSGGSSSKKETEEEFDWIETKIKNLEEDISRLDKISDSSYSSVSEKNKALADGIEKINEEINLQQQAYERYMTKAESVGLSDEYKNLVRDGAVDIESIADDDLKEAIKNYEQWYDKAKETQDKINDLYDDAKDKHVAAYELEAGEIEKLRDNQAITEREYLDAMLALYEKYYAANTEFANQAKEAKLKYLQEEKEYLETVAGSAASLLDDQIDNIEKDKDKEHKKYDDQIADIEDIIKAKEKDADAIQDQIDAIKDENDELDRQKNLREALRKEQEAQIALERAKNQRTKLLYKNGQMVWDVDDSAIREANKNVEDAQAAVDKAKKDIIIANLQMQIDAIQDGIDALEEQKAQLEALADESDAFFDKKIADIEAYQNEWREALEIEERSIAIENLKSMFGEDAVAQILAHNTTLLDMWKQTCIDTMAAIDLATSGSVGAITQQWGELAGVSVDMDKAMELSGLSMEELTKKADMLGISIGHTAESSKQIGDTLNETDTSPASEQFQNAGLSAQEMQQQVEGVSEKLNTLTSEVQNFSIPAIDTRQFAASLGGEDGTGGILGQLNTFIERFRWICSEIPSIWNGMMKSMSGQGTVPGESAGYDSMFAPLLNAMDGTKLEIDGKLKEYAESWMGFNETLGEIIGVGAGSSSGGAKEHQSSGAGIPSTNSGSGKQKTDKDGSSDSIVGTIESGGEAVIQSFDEVWIPGFEGFASRIDEICMNVCAMVEDMANEVIKMVNDALKAMKELEAKNTGAYRIDKVGSSYSAHAVSPANASGTLSSADGRGAVTKDQTSLVNELGNEMIARQGTLYEVQGGAQQVQLKKGDIVFNHRQTEELKKYNRVTSSGGHGKVVGSFASGTVNSSKASILDSNIRDMWSSDEFKELLENVKKLGNGQSIIIDQNNTILKDKNGDPYREGTIITPKGDVYTPLPDTHPIIQLQKKFDAYVQKMGGIDFLGANAMIEHNRQMDKWTKEITNSNVINNVANNRPEVSIGDIYVTCPGVTERQVAEQIGGVMEKELNRMFNGMHLDAEQRSHMR